MKNLSKVSRPKKVLFIGLGILALGIVVLAIGLLQSPVIWKAFQCGYDLSLNNSTLTRDQISEYCSNNQTLKTENTEDMTTIGFGIIIIVNSLSCTQTPHTEILSPTFGLGICFWSWGTISVTSR